MSIWLIRWNGTNRCWEVGFFNPQGRWEMFDNYRESSEAVVLCHYLNGGSK